MRIVEQSFEILDWSNLDLYRRVETAARVCRRSESKGDAEGFVRSLIKRGHFSPLEFARIKETQTWATPFNVRRLREEVFAERGKDYSRAREELKSLAEQFPAFAEGMEGLLNESPAARVEPANDWIPVLFTTSRTISHQLVRYRHDICYMQESQRHCRYDETGIEVIEPLGLGMVNKDTWKSGVRYSEETYRIMMHRGATAEQARAVLPGCTVTRILAYASPAEWRHIFYQRCCQHADPQMQALMFPLRETMEKRRLV